MKLKPLLSISFTYLSIAAFNTNAALIDNGMHTTDDNTGLVWLDLTETFTASYADTYNATLTGGTYENYRIATRAELETLFSDYLYDISLWDLWGNSGSPITGVFFDDPAINEIITGTASHGAILDDAGNTINAGARSINESGQLISTALIQVQAVPVPSSIWLLFSGLIGLTGFTKRKKHKS